MDAAGGRKEYISYDYKEIHAEEEKVSFLLDSYECFGWEVDEKMSAVRDNIHARSYSPKVTIHLKRNRKILNKMELTRLQRNFEACMKEISVLEGRKTSTASMRALTIGLIGTAFMAGSVFAVTAQPPIIWLCIILAVPAFICWLLPVFVYKKLLEKSSEQINPLIEAKYDEIYEICEKGNKLLY